MKAQTKFDQHLRFTLKLPVTGISGTGLDCKIYFAPEATPEQVQQAYDARDSFDWSEPAPPPEYKEKRGALYAERSVGDQLDAIYHFAKDLPKYLLAGGITPDDKAAIGTPEEWLAWQDKVRADVPKE